MTFYSPSSYGVHINRISFVCTSEFNKHMDASCDLINYNIGTSMYNVGKQRFFYLHIYNTRIIFARTSITLRDNFDLENLLGKSEDVCIFKIHAWNV